MIFMTLQKTLKKFGETLAGLPVSVFHYHRGKIAPPVVIWQEDSEGNSFPADDRRAEPMIAGSLDYYTQTEYDPVVEQINELLQESTEAWELVSVQYEEDTKLIHYSWDWEIGYG